MVLWIWSRYSLILWNFKIQHLHECKIPKLQQSGIYWIQDRKRNNFNFIIALFKFYVFGRIYHRNTYWKLYMKIVPCKFIMQWFQFQIRITNEKTMLLQRETHAKIIQLIWSRPLSTKQNQFHQRQTLPYIWRDKRIIKVKSRYAKSPSLRLFDIVFIIHSLHTECSKNSTKLTVSSLLNCQSNKAKDKWRYFAFIQIINNNYRNGSQYKAFVLEYGCSCERM